MQQRSKSLILVTPLLFHPVPGQNVAPPSPRVPINYNLPILNDEYYERFISKAEVQNYKKIVGIRGNNFNLSKYSLNDFENITLQNVLKANYIVNNLKCIPTYEDFMLLLQSNSILDKQFVYIEIQNKIYILCCALFVYISFFGKKYYSKITSK